MVLFETAFAVVLLTAPSGEVLLPGDLAHLRPSRQSLQALAVEWELLDPREAATILPEGSTLASFAADVAMLQRRYLDLADAPPVADAWRFPRPEAVSDLLDFNRAYRGDWARRQEADSAHWWKYQQVIEEVDDLYWTWDLIRDAGREWYYVTARRRALADLRCRLGREAYHSGAMPPHVPLWRFVRIH